MLSSKIDTNNEKRPRVGDGKFLYSSELEVVRSEILSFIRTRVADVDVQGVIVPMSGGIDSTLTTILAVEALGSDRVLGLGLPWTKTDGFHQTEAQTMADGLGIEFHEIPLQPILEVFEDIVTPTIPTIETNDRSDSIGNVVARLRMVCTYYAANAQSRLVCGTANRSELLLGYFTKYGDGGADLYPLGDLYKTEVRALASHIGLPRRIINKAPTAGLRPGQTDAEDLGATYRIIDPLLQRIVDRGERVRTAANALNVDMNTAERIASLFIETVHKRTVPPSPGISTPWGNRSSYPTQQPEEERYLYEEQ
ncbi:NAD+ synthase [Haladaptatus pallidirubidus]|uniref:NAD+ synthase n=1 Tax=Haladaptatus pallidirubidus TaxID=1008152 RepID=UPI0035F01A6C